MSIFISLYYEQLYLFCHNGQQTMT